MMERGCPERLGARVVDGGVNFALHSAVAESVELCLFDDAGNETRMPLPEQSAGVWHGFLPDCRAHQRYGYRVHGPYDPGAGLRCNPAKLLLDPYARELSGPFRWSPGVFDYRRDGDELVADTTDSASLVPKSVVLAGNSTLAGDRVKIPWSETIVYETNVRGYTMRHPEVPDTDRGRFAGMRNADVLSYLRSLGITTIELMPVFEFVDEEFLHAQGLRNYWGYNSISFFVPASRYAHTDPRAEFLEMINALHDAGFEVILDVAYNHTGESGADGPTISFRGIDNLGYYRTEAGDPGRYVNDTGTGNTLNMDTPHVRRLVLDSLRYWLEEMRVDGFRFDLATVLGRTAQGYTKEHPFFAAMAADPRVGACKLIAEPWDPGPGGYQLGHFPPSWAEWNDRYRDSVRRFWRGDDGEAAEFARRLHGSSDIFEHGGRGPSMSVNFVSAHDGFTLADLVSYAERHNEANGEDNRDGHAHNFSHNHGAEGPTADTEINARRRQQRLNLLATLFFSQGTPMLLAGDEFGNSQHGNNNVYAQDNDTGWVDWAGCEDDPEFVAAVRALIELRKNLRVFQRRSYFHGAKVDEIGWRDIQWLHTDGQPLADEGWDHADSFSLVLTRADDEEGPGWESAAVMINRSDNLEQFVLPTAGTGKWQIRFVSAAQFRPLADDRWEIPPHSLVCAALTHA